MGKDVQNTTRRQLREERKSFLRDKKLKSSKFRRGWYSRKLPPIARRIARDGTVAAAAPARAASRDAGYAKRVPRVKFEKTRKNPGNIGFRKKSLYN